MPARVVLAIVDAAVLQEAEAALQMDGLAVAAFSNSMEALKALEGARAVAVLVTGISFPDQQPNGLSLALMTQRQRPDVRLIFVGPEHAAPAVQDLGQLLVEPVNVSALVAAVRTAVPES